MNTIRMSLLAVVTSVLLSGCAGGSGVSEYVNCENALKFYNVYLVSLAVREPSADEIKYAKLGATLLQAHCGYTSSGVNDGGVPILVSPRGEVVQRP
jgi:hypothetical protein